MRCELIVVPYVLGREELPLAALTLSAYDPAFDRDGAVRAAALAVVEAVAGAART